MDGQAATLTAVVSDTTTPATVPTGGVSFTDTVGTTVVSLNGGVAVPLVAGTATLQVTPTVVGVHTITANFVGSTVEPSVRLAPRGAPRTFASSSGTATLTVTGIAPTLSFAPIAAQTYGNPPFAVSATSASSGAVTYAVVSGPATIAGNIVTLTGAGTVVLSASQAASGNYAAATATTSFTVAADGADPELRADRGPDVWQPAVRSERNFCIEWGGDLHGSEWSGDHRGQHGDADGGGHGGAERQPGSQRELCRGNGHHQLHRGRSGFGLHAHPQRRLRR